MPQIDALDALKNGRSAWEDFVRDQESSIDLTMAPLEGKDLSGYNFRNCNFAGAQLNTCNLDKVKFVDCSFLGTNFSDASIVSSKFMDCKCTSTIFKTAVVRNTIFENCSFDKSDYTEVSFEHCKFRNTSVRESIFIKTLFLSSEYTEVELLNLDSQDAIFRFCIIEYSIFRDSHFDYFAMNNCDVRNSDFRNIESKKLTLKETDLTSCVFDKVFEEAIDLHVSALNLSETQIIRTDLRIFNLNTAAALETKFIDCKFPPQRGTISIFGSYEPSPSLLRQAVQDTKGIGPVLRRTIADEQYIRQLHENASPLKAIALKGWAMTTGFGQSILRLTITTCIILLLMAILLLFARGQLFGWTPNPKLLWIATQDAANSLLSLNQPPSQTNLFEKVILGTGKVGGVILLGLWISVASSKIVKLGSQ